MSDQEDPWEQVAREAMAREAKREASERRPKGPRALVAPKAVCSGCSKEQRITDHGTFVVHFATLASQRPCEGSWKVPCADCGQLLASGKDGLVHHATGSKDCPQAAPPGTPAPAPKPSP